MRPFLLKQAYFIKMYIFTKIIINDMRPSLIRTFQAVVSAVIMVSFLVACGPQEPEVKNVPVSGVSVSPASLSLVVGDTANLTAKVSPSDATSQTVTWSSSNQSVASVSNGTVTALQEGKTTITATAGGKSATCEVTVSAKVIPVTGISFEQASVSIPMGETANLIATVSPSDAPDRTVSWSSSNASVASVSSGVVKAVSEGNATVTASCGGKSATCAVTVQKKTIPVSSVTLKPTSLTLIQGESATLTLTVAPADATEQTVTWNSSNPSIVTVADGKVTAVREGTATISASCGGKSAECAVTVSNNTTGNNEGTGDENWD